MKDGTIGFPGGTAPKRIINDWKRNKYKFTINVKGRKKGKDYRKIATWNVKSLGTYMRKDRKHRNRNGKSKVRNPGNE